MFQNTLPQWLVRYGLFLISIGILAVLYEPKSGHIGFNSAAKTALISGSICGGLSIGWGLLLGRGYLWTRVGAIVTSALFLAAFTWRATAGWMAWAGGQPEKWFAATLISCMWVATLGMLVMLARNRAVRAWSGFFPELDKSDIQPTKP
jgi:hypothetical protein